LAACVACLFFSVLPRPVVFSRLIPYFLVILVFSRYLPCCLEYKKLGKTKLLSKGPGPVFKVLFWAPNHLADRFPGRLSIDRCKSQQRSAGISPVVWQTERRGRRLSPSIFHFPAHFLFRFFPFSITRPAEERKKCSLRHTVLILSALCFCGDW